MVHGMQAAILVESKKALVVDEVALPKDLHYGQVLVKIIYSGICGSQIGEIDGVKGYDKYLPHLLGHEGSGIVEKVGHGVTRVKPGDHVVLHWRKAAGVESPTPTYQWGSKKVNAGPITTFNQYAVVAENRLTPIPKTLDLKVAALFGCAVTTAIGIINNDANVKIGESVVIFGVGGVGLNLAQAASLVSAYPIIGIDIHNNKLALASKMGLTHALNGKDQHLSEQIQTILNHQGADVVIDTTGNPRVIEQAYELTHANGRTILVGVPKVGDNISIYSLPLHFKKSLKGSHGGNTVPDEDIPRYLRLLDNGKLKLDDVITQEFSLQQINEAIDLMRNGQISGRIIINMES